jgi:hypothetical protein
MEELEKDDWDPGTFGVLLHCMRDLEEEKYDQDDDAISLRKALERVLKRIIEKAQPTICEHYSPEKCGCVCERRGSEG